MPQTNERTTLENLGISNNSDLISSILTGLRPKFINTHQFKSAELYLSLLSLLVICSSFLSLTQPSLRWRAAARHPSVGGLCPVIPWIHEVLNDESRIESSEGHRNTTQPGKHLHNGESQCLMGKQTINGVN